MSCGLSAAPLMAENGSRIAPSAISQRGDGFELRASKLASGDD